LSSSTSWLRPDLIQVSPSTRWGQEELDAILEKVRLPLMGGGALRGPLRRTLKTLADWMVIHAAEAPPLSQEDVRRIATSFQKLRKAFRHDAHVPNTPPQMPASWVAAMEQWIARETTPGRPGNPADWFDQFSYPKLLGFFQVAYGMKPSKTANGPAHRFLMEFFARLKSDVERNYSHDDPEVKARILRHCAPPTAEALRHRLREVEADPSWVIQVMLQHASRSSE
jgi:hypothetical protein